MGIVIGIAGGVIALALIVYFLKKKPAPPEASQTKIDSGADAQEVQAEAPAGVETSEKEEKPSADEAAEAPAEEEKAGAEVEVPEEKTKEEPEEEAAEGVRLDESAEETAVQDLKRARRERKLEKLRTGLSKTRGGFIAKIGDLFRGKKEIDEELLNELEEALITSDVGAETTDWLVQLIKSALDKDELKDPDEVWQLLKQEITNILSIDAAPWDYKSDTPFTIMVVGVNGTGKTTTIGKLAASLTKQGHKVVLAAADTFRAAAVSQLEIWGRRTNSDVVKPAKEQTDPSSVVFDAIKKAKETGADIVIADTAGRLHTQAPLMEELKKIKRVMGKAHENAPHETLMVLDATTGQNAIAQVKQFGEALELSSIALTKLDGTAKGGVIVGVCHEHKIPVRYIGIGESKDSLREFDVEDFVDALFYKDQDED